MKSHEIQACSFSEWYPLFKKVTFPSKIIPLTQEFVDYLLADNLVLRSDQALLTYSRDDSNSSDSEDDEEGWAKAESETPALEVLILSVLVFLYFIILAFLGPTF
jgi:hypothetical protein